MWRCMCQGCGAPLQLVDIQCSYCLRATGVNPERAIVVTAGGRLSEAQVNRIRDEWESAYARGGRPLSIPEFVEVTTFIDAEPKFIEISQPRKSYR